MTRHIFAMLILLFVPLSSVAAEVTLERLLAAPFPMNLVAAPAGDRIAWVENDEGVRNVWVAEGAQFLPRRVTAYSNDDGQAIGSLAWSRDAKEIFYVRGGNSNRSGDHPNPTSDPEGVEQAIWRVAVAGNAAPVKFAVGTQPTLSPTGAHVAFVSRGDVIVATAADPDKRQAVRARGGASNLRWSPDGAQLAFVSERGTHSFIAVYDVARRSLRFLDPKIEIDGDPVWSPDGKQIAFIRTPVSSKPQAFRPLREAHPWSIVVADVGTGAARTVWRASKGVGSVFHAVEARDQLAWLRDGTIVFPWERNGWVQLYAVAAAGGQARLLTPGEFEVEQVTTTPDGAALVYSSNQNDIDRRHLWRVSPQQPPQQITTGDGIEWAPAVTTSGRIAFLRSTAITPARPALLEARSAMRDLRSVASYPAASLVTPQAVELTAADGVTSRAQLFLPRGASAKRSPAVIFLHGGSRRQMLLGFHNRGYYHRAYAFNQYLATLGYVVLSVNYRSGIGYGQAFREALDYGVTGGSEFNDVLAAGRYLRGRADVDPARIGLWGGSYGGYLTALGLARASDMFAAGVDIHGVHDWNMSIQVFEEYNPLEHPELARIAREASPISSVETWRSPVLLIHGDDDRNVAFRESVILVEALREQGIEAEQLVFPDEVHDFLVHQNWLKAYDASAEFLDRHLRRRER